MLYKNPEMEILKFEEADVIRTSDTVTPGGVVDETTNLPSAEIPGGWGNQ